MFTLIAGVLTAKRPRNPLISTLRSLRASGFDSEVYTFAGSPDVDHLNMAAEYGPLRTATPGKSFWKTVGWDKLSPVKRCAVAKAFMLDCLSRGRKSFDAALYFEDDVLFSRDWLVNVCLAVQDLIDKHGRKFILTLSRMGCWYPGEVKKAAATGKKWYRVNPLTFKGTQAVIFGRDALPGLADSIVKNCIFKGLRRADEETGRFADRNGIPIYATAPCLVEHMSVPSIVAPDKVMRKSDLFVEET